MVNSRSASSASAPNARDASEYEGLLNQAREIFGERIVKIIWRGDVTAQKPNGVSVMEAPIGLVELRTAISIAEQLLEVEAKPIVQSWFAGMNPMLDDRSPALVVRNDPQAVRDAARHFLAYG